MLTPGQRVERYVVQRPLGEGGMARVYEVVHAVLGTRHALKVLHRPAPGLRERLVREGQLQARLASPQVVPVTDVLDCEGAPALLMPCVVGCTLADVLSGLRPTEDEVRAIFASVLAGVASAHGHGVVHRDLKPSNILLDEHYGLVRVRVADFGLARDTLDEESRLGLMGTPAYASPEQLTEASAADQRSDLWSLGVILYELLTGSRPFPQTTLAELLRAASSGSWDQSLLSETWRPLVGSLLEVDPARRPASVDAVRDALGPPVPPIDAASRIGRFLQDHVRAERTAEAHAATVGAVETRVGGPEPRMPRERDAFVGREQDLAALRDRLDSGARLVSVRGPGGTGKTRLVLHHAWSTARDWPGGVAFCDLTDARDRDGLVRGVASGLDILLGPGDDLSAIGTAILQRGRTLVVLDNVEQIVEPVREALRSWLNRCPEATFVVTTRVVLGLSGEVDLMLAPLEPTDSTELFLARARTARRGFDPGPDELRAVEQLVELLDHLPLAIELAAARTRVLRPGKLLRRMGDRFRLLTSQGAASRRQATLRATLDWSWDLLSPAEQDGFAQLSVFEGGFDLEAAEEVVDLSEHPDAPWALDLVQSLVDKSLVRTVADDRFDLLVSLKEYGAERLAERRGAETVRVRHAEHYATWGSPASIGSLERDPSPLREWPRDLENLVSATRWSIQQEDASLLVPLLQATGQVLRRQGPFELYRALTRQACAVPGLRPDERDVVDLLHGSALALCGQLAEAVPLYQRVVTSADARADPALELDARLGLGFLLMRLSRNAEAQEQLDAGVASARRMGARESEARALDVLGVLTLRSGRLLESRDLFEQARAICRAEHLPLRLAFIESNLGVLLVRLGELEETERCLDSALRAHVEYRNRKGHLEVLTSLSTLRSEQGRLHESTALLEEGIALARQLGDRFNEGMMLGNLGNRLHSMRRLDQAVDAYQRALAIHEEVGNRHSQANVLANLANALGSRDEDLEEAIDRCKQAIRLMRELHHGDGLPAALNNLGRLEFRAGRIDDARARLEEALERSIAIQMAKQVSQAASSVAELELGAGRLQRVREVLDLAEPSMRALGTPIMLGELARRRGELAAAEGDAVRAREHLRTSVEHMARAGNAAAEATVSVVLAALELDQGESPAARRALDRARELVQRVSGQPREKLEARIAELESAVGALEAR